MDSKKSHGHERWQGSTCWACMQQGYICRNCPRAKGGVRKKAPEITAVSSALMVHDFVAG